MESDEDCDQAGAAGIDDKRTVRPTLIAGLLAVLVTASPVCAATPRCPLPQDNGYRPQTTKAGRKALPRLNAWVIRDCLPDEATGPVRRKLSVRPTVRLTDARRIASPTPLGGP